ncbi:DoxX family protein [Burkholderia cenocepacia]|uniref:DoxX family protein n=1 Tax=Burkholderia cenocepacia TaxID=95486 RepID=UPI001B8E1B42|nr:DoxX family membrane protein [Burkholderia cenocepacia]
MLLAQPWVLPVSRLMLVSAYLIAGVYKLLGFDAAAAEQAHFGLHPGSVWAAMAIVLEIGGLVLVTVLNDRRDRAGSVPAIR